MKPWTVAEIFHSGDVAACFAALHTHAARLFHADASSPLLPYAHRRGSDRGYRRDHLEMPLQHLHDRTHAYTQLPMDVQHICAGLHDTVHRYAEAALREPCVLPAARAEMLNALGKRSVLRVLRYPAGSGCRPHVDPGLCTALLGGSAGGLEVNTIDALPPSFTNRPGDYTTRVNGELHGAQASQRGRGDDLADPTQHIAAHSTENALDCLPHWQPVVTAHAGEVVLMAGNMMSVVSHGKLSGVLHRVRHDWQQRRHSGDSVESLSPPVPSSLNERSGERAAACGGNDASLQTRMAQVEAADIDDYRYNIIVELRPASAKRWYAMSKNGLGCTGIGRERKK